MENKLDRTTNEYRVMKNLYAAAAEQIKLKFQILDRELSLIYDSNPIHHIESRIKSAEGIEEKLIKKGYPVSVESAMKNVNDIAGVRVVCNYIHDVYRVSDMFLRQTDIKLIKKQDYIEHPNYNGYRSLHLDIEIPVFLSDHTVNLQAEVQIRTIAMDFWASLEHDVRYKAKNKYALPEGINEEMLECAGQIAEIDKKMQDMYIRIKNIK